MSVFAHRCFVVSTLAVFALSSCFFAPTESGETTSPDASGEPSATMSTTDSTASTSAPTATSLPAVCGDGVVEGDETCDDGNAVDEDACTNVCLAARCGDGIVGPGELCDGGGATPLCDDDCTDPACGDGVANAAAGEACDDGGVKGGPCSPTCTSTRLVDIAAGSSHTCVVIEGGTVRCWGNGYHGELGSESMDHLGDEPGELPTVDVDLLGPVEQIAAGGYSTCGVFASGVVRCWGKNDFGQLGLGHTESIGDGLGVDEMPPLAADIGASVHAVGVGNSHACARTTLNRIRCWGVGSSLGYPELQTLGDEPGELPPPDVPGLENVTDLAVGEYTTCAVLHDGLELWCWSSGEMPHLLDVGGPIRQVAVGNAHYCVLLKDGHVRCWGQNNRGQLGYENTDPISEGALPSPEVDLGGLATQIAVGNQHTCALLESGAVKCWGAGYGGALGSGATIDVGDSPEEMPPPDVALGGPARRIVAHGSQHTCAELADFTLRCWGVNHSGQLGYGNTQEVGDDEVPASVGPVPF